MERGAGLETFVRRTSRQSAVCRVVGRGAARRGGSRECADPLCCDMRPRTLQHRHTPRLRCGAADGEQRDESAHEGTMRMSMHDGGWGWRWDE